MFILRSPRWILGLCDYWLCYYIDKHHSYVTYTLHITSNSIQQQSSRADETVMSISCRLADSADLSNTSLTTEADTVPLTLPSSYLWRWHRACCVTSVLATEMPSWGRLLGSNCHKLVMWHVMTNNNDLRLVDLISLANIFFGVVRLYLVALEHGFNLARSLEVLC